MFVRGGNGGCGNGGGGGVGVGVGGFGAVIYTLATRSLRRSNVNYDQINRLMCIVMTDINNDGL